MAFYHKYAAVLEKLVNSMIELLHDESNNNNDNNDKK